MEDSLSHLEKLAALKKSHGPAPRLSQLISPRSFRDVAQLPCFVLPLARGSHFFDRDDVIDEIERRIEVENSEAWHSFALYGMGGVGKSHVTLKYIERKKAGREMDAIFWVDGETAVSMDDSFTDIALRLKLPEARQNTRIENRMIVKEWLQQTGMSTYHPATT